MFFYLKCLKSIYSLFLILKQHPVENSGSSTSSASSSNSANYGTLGRNTNSGQTGSMASMMDEMARTLARRRAAVEKKEPIECPQVSDILKRSIIFICYWQCV